MNFRTEILSTVQLQIFVVQNFHEIAENPMTENFHDKHFVIATFFMITTAPRHPCRQFTLSFCPQLHMAWRQAAGQSEKKRNQIKTYTGLSFCLQRLLLSSVWTSLQRGCWRIRYKTKDIVWTEILADLVSNFCSFSESKCTESVHHQQRFNASLHSSHIHQLTSIACVHVHMIALVMRMCTQNVATPTIIPNFHEENFRDQNSNHKIHENIVPQKFGAIWCLLVFIINFIIVYMYTCS